jgi:PAS domain-containing protein
MARSVPTEPEVPRHLAEEIGEFRGRLEELRSRHEGRPVDADTLLAELETAHEELRVAEEEVRAQQEELDEVAQLQRAERWLHERLISMLPAAVLVTDGQGVVQTLNAAAAALLRLRVDRVMRKPLFSFVDPADRSDLRQLLVRAVAAGGSFRTTATLLPRGLEPLQAELAATVARDERRGTTRVTWVCLRGEPDRAAATAGDPLLAQCLVDLTRQAVDTDDITTVLTRIARLCQRAFPLRTWVSVTVGDPAEPQLVASDSVEAQAVDGAQVVAGEGPCHLAWQHGETATTDDLVADLRWPRLSKALGTSPVTAAVAVPVSVGENRLGALNVYGDDATLASAPLVRSAELLAAAIGAVLQETEAKAELAEVAEQLQEAMRSRATIEQAKGILIATHGCDADEAFRLLAQMSSRTNVKLRVIAARIVEDAARHPTQSAGRPPASRKPPLPGPRRT